MIDSCSNAVDQQMDDFQIARKRNDRRTMSDLDLASHRYGPFVPASLRQSCQSRQQTGNQSVTCDLQGFIHEDYECIVSPQLAKYPSRKKYHS